MRIQRFSLIDKLFNLIERQRPSDRILMRVLFFIIIASSIYFVISINDKYTLSIPTQGGSLVEGIIGVPRFINPALAITRADQDTVALLYSGLLEIDTDGSLKPDLAENLQVSENGLVYHITLKQNRFFHDGTPITADDVIFTLELIKNSELKSPLRGNWNNTALKKINDYELEVTLTEAYSPFIENFTVGIMPKHVWQDLPIEQLPFSQYNTEPVGSGPFAVSEIKRDTSGLIKSYILKPNPYSIQTPNLETVELKFFQNEELLTKAFENNDITSTVYLSNSETNSLNPAKVQIISKPLPRIFGIYFNQNRSPALRDKSVRQALNVAVDRNKLINKVFNGYGVPTTKPILFAKDELKSSSNELNNNPIYSLDTAENILKEGGWTKNDSGFWEKEIDKATETLSLTIKTGNSELFNKISATVAEDWRKLGVQVQVEQYEQTGLVQSVIRVRDFQALLFGVDMNRSQDLYPFWHSSQKDDPGLNIAQYTNVKVDRLLEESRTTSETEARQKTLLEISDMITDEVPTVFLFAPTVTYVIDKDMEVVVPEKLSKSPDRFTHIDEWHAKTQTLWPIFNTEK